MTPPALSPLLTTRDLARLERMRLGCSRRFTNRARGEHLSGKGGASTEFCDYRDYASGDDLRFVDWNIFARIQRPYLKQFHHEEELHVCLLVDGSGSMLGDGKIELARRLAAAFAVAALHGNERVSAAMVGGERTARLAATQGRAGVRNVLSFLEKTSAGGALPIEAGVEDFLRQHSGRGCAVIVSDFLSDGDLRRAFSLLHGAGLEVFALQILSPGELAPDLGGDLRLVDTETGEHLDITNAADLLALYHEQRESLAARVSGLCRQAGGKFLTVSSGEAFEPLVFGTLRKKGWLL